MLYIAYLSCLVQQWSDMGEASGHVLLAGSWQYALGLNFCPLYLVLYRLETPMMVPALSSRGSVPKFIQRTVTSRLVRGLSRVAATATPLSLQSRPMSPTCPLGSELSLQLTCTSLSGGKVSVLVTWILLASRRPVRSVHGMVLPPITNSPLSQAPEQSCRLRNSISRIALSDMRQTRNLASNSMFLS